MNNKLKYKRYKPIKMLIDEEAWTYEITTSMYRSSNTTSPKIEYCRRRYKSKLLFPNVQDIAIFKNLHFFYTLVNVKPYIAILIYPKTVKYKK